MNFNVKIVFALIYSFFFFQIFSQNVNYTQGFESTSSGCTHSLTYTGGAISSSTAYSGSNSIRIGNLGGSNNLLFSNIDVSNLNNSTLSFRHRVLSGSGPGMDSREGVAFLIALDGGPYGFVSGVSGYGDMAYDWNSIGGSLSVSSGCNSYQTSNSFSYSIPIGTSTISLKIVSVRAGSCAAFNTDMVNGNPSNFDRADEGIYIDNVTISGNISQPTIACYQIATWENSLCDWVVNGNQPSQPNIACYQTANWDNALCDWVISGIQPAQPILACYQSATWDNTLCDWVISGAQPSQPSQACYQTATWDNALCDWIVGGTQPSQPTVACYQTAAWDNVLCDWVVSGTQTSSVIINGSSNNICSGTNVTLEATGFPSGGTYKWSTGSSYFSINVAPTNKESFIVVYSINGCEVSDTIEIEVQPKPIISVSNCSICKGSSANILANSSIIGGSFLWSNGQVSDNITVSPLNSTTYSVLYTLNGCKYIGTGVVTVNPIPSISVSSTQICENETASLVATTNLTGGLFNWSGSSETTGVLNVKPNQSTNYTVSYSLNGCKSQDAIAYVVVKPKPSVSVNSEEICLGDSVKLIAIPSISGGSFLWLTTGECSNTIVVSPVKSSNYFLVYTLDGCSSNQAISNISIKPIPNVSFLVDKNFGCAPLSVAFTSEKSNQTSYNWYINGDLVDVNDEMIYVFSNSGCYEIGLKASANGCTRDTTIQNLICVENPPVASFKTNPKVFGNTIETIVFDNNSMDAFEFNWNFGDGTSSTEKSPTHVFNNTENGYTVELEAISMAGCSSLISVFIPYEVENEIYIPNSFTPNDDQTNEDFLPIFSNPETIVEYRFEIYNRWGELIFETNEFDVGWSGYLKDTNQASADGIYTYVITIRDVDFIPNRTIGHFNLLK